MQLAESKNFFQIIQGGTEMDPDMMLLSNALENARECYTPEENNPYPLCIGGKLPECVNCQLRADWEPDAPYCVCVQIEDLREK